MRNKDPFTILKTPIVTERAQELKAQNKYLFKVDPDVSKIEIRKAVEKLYSVKVASVNVMNRMGKPKRAGKMMKEGRRSGFKKAIITLSEGVIEIV